MEREENGERKKEKRWRKGVVKNEKGVDINGGRGGSKKDRTQREKRIEEG